MIECWFCQYILIAKYVISSDGIFRNFVQTPHFLDIYYTMDVLKFNTLKSINQLSTLLELCHEILIVTAIHMVRSCSTDHFP